MPGIITRRKGGKRARRPASKGDAVGQYASDAWSLAKRTAYGLNEIRKLINIETKFWDTVQSAATQSTTGNAYSLTRMGQGLTSTDRVGDSIKLQHIEVRGRVVIATAGTTSLVRVAIVRDLDGYGTAATPADAFELNGAGQAPLSPWRFNRRERFSVLYDELFTVQGSTSDGVSSFPFYYNSAHSGHVLYLGATAAATSDGKGTVYLMACTDETVNLPTIAFYSRVMFTDD